MPGSDWWQDAVVYQIYPRSFQDSDGDGIGDLNGIRDRLDYLVQLGVDAFWLSPIYASPNADWGYDVSDHRAIHPDFGTLDDFDALVAAAHERGRRVILDLVPSHTSVEHPWFRDHPDWYVWADEPRNNWKSAFGGSAWSLDGETGRYYLHSFYPEQPDLDWGRVDVRDAIGEIVRFWLGRGVDGFRVDAVDRLSKDSRLRDDPPRLEPALLPLPDDYGSLDHVHSRNTPAPELLAPLREAAGHALLVGEVYRPTGELTPYLETFDLLFAFELMLAEWNAARLAGVLEPACALGQLAWVLSNHDFTRLASRVGAENVRLAATLQLTLPGTAFIYQGDELGLEGGPAYDVVLNEAEDEGAAYVDVWDVGSGSLRSRPLGSLDIVGARLAGDGSRLVTVTSTEIATWDTRTMRRLSAVHPTMKLGGYADVSASGRTVAAEIRGSGALVFIDALSGRVIRARGGGDHGLALTVRFAPDDRTVATSHDDGTVMLWNPATGRPVEKLVGHGGRSVGAAYSPDGAALYSSSLYGAIFEWGIGGERRFGQQFHSGPRARSLPDVPQTPPLAVAPDGSQFAVRVGRSRLALYSLPALQRRTVIAVGPRAGPITALAWSPNGDQLAIATRDGPVQLWHAGPRPQPLRHLRGLDAVQAVAFAPEQRLVAAVDHDRRSGRGRLALWRTGTGKTASLLDLPGEGRSIAFSLGGDKLTVGLDDGQVLVIEAATQQVARMLHPAGAPNVALRFAPDGTLLTGSWAGTVQRWDASSGEEIGRATLVSAGPVGSISFGRDAELLATTGLADGRAKLWAASPLHQLGSSFHHPPGAQAANAAITADGRSLIVVYDDGSGAVWPITVDAWKRHACAVAGRNLTREEWSRFLSGEGYRTTCPNGTR